ncbi:YhdT family protein [Virgibacillus halophilus]|uniref:YhdT family protein n=1 Tax=Tigheibacillus halophilus TaxID=361280 RepID=A0ABU5C857_9BACI|nr:YhdT family protein [Virgibacillus halophilus]
MDEDKRFKSANKEALFGVGLAVFNFIWWFTCAYGIGGRNPTKYTFILGLPAWFFYSCVVGFIVITILVIIVVKYFFADIPLDDEEGGGQ